MLQNIDKLSALVSSNDDMSSFFALKQLPATALKQLLPGDHIQRRGAYLGIPHYTDNVVKIRDGPAGERRWRKAAFRRAAAAVSEE